MVPEGVTRREALRLVGGATVASLAGCNRAVEEGTEPSETTGDRSEHTDTTEPSETEADLGTEPETHALSELTLIDVHTHLVPERAFGREPFKADAAVEWMDAHGIDQIVLQPLESPTSWSFPIPSWWVLREAEKHPDRFVPFGTVAPQMVDQFERDQLRKRIRRYVEMGAKGVGELKAPMAVDDQRVQAVYEECASLDVPVLFHMDDTNGTDSIGLSKLEGMLSSYPDTSFIAHGPGWWSQISGDPEQFGGYPRGSVEPGGPIPRLLGEYDNIYADLSGGSGWNAVARDEEFAQSFLSSFHEQIIFGTDKLSSSKAVDQFELFSRFDLGRAKWANVRYENIERLLS